MKNRGHILDTHLEFDDGFMAAELCRVTGCGEPAETAAVVHLDDRDWTFEVCSTHATVDGVDAALPKKVACGCKSTRKKTAKKKRKSKN